MPHDSDSKIFTIRSHTWNETNRDFKSDLASLLKTDLPKAGHFCEEYFNKFYLIHQLGHILLMIFDPEEAQRPARTEYLANLFAVKYFEYKKEHEYLDRLGDCLTGLAQAYKALFDFKIDALDGLYHKYRRDIVTLAAWHFNALRAARRNTGGLAEVLAQVSGGALSVLNGGILPRKNLRGQALLQECQCTIFEMNDIMPDIRLEYCPNLDLENFALSVMPVEQQRAETASV